MKGSTEFVWGLEAGREQGRLPRIGSPELIKMQRSFYILTKIFF